jgi:arylformamidase
MIIEFNISGDQYSSDTSAPMDISIPMLFNGPQPNIYDVPQAESHAFEQGDFVGAVRRGGGCNFEQYTLIPHCNGTHTEGVGHISYDRININDILKDSFIPATLISIETIKGEETDEYYIPDKEDGNYLITRQWIESQLANANAGFLKVLIIRTLPNDDSKKSRRYMNDLPPFFSVDAMEFIDQLGVEHLILDIPSVDRTFDEGKLTTHHIFWKVEQGSHDVKKDGHSMKTITEMAYIPDDIPDGRYLVNIQIPNFTADAAPSRVLIYNVEKS